jgi:ribokinase
VPAFDLVTLGHACTDLLVHLDRFPERDTKREVECIAMQGGGPAATAAVTAARLGLRVAFIGQVGGGPFGTVAISALREAGVDVSGVEVRSDVDGSRLALVFVDPRTAERTIVFTRAGLPGLDPARLERQRITSAGLLLTDDLDVPAAIQAAGWARRAGVPVLVDAGSARPGMRELVASADCLIASSRFAPALLGIDDPGEAVRALGALGPRWTGVTLGAGGALVHDGERTVHQPAFEVEAVDTTGAGDVFHGAFAAGMLDGWGIERCARFAAAAAALACTRLGAQAGVPTRAAIADLLARGEAAAGRSDRSDQYSERK